MKKLISIFLCALLLTCNVCAFNDADGHWAQEEIEKWQSAGYINGDEENNINPDQFITRGDFAVIIDRVMNYYTPAENTFTDLQECYYTLPVLRLNREKVMTGYDSTIRPDDYISRQEAVVMLSRAFMLEEADSFDSSFVDEQKVAPWAKPYMAYMANNGYIQGSDGKLTPEDYITRAQTVKLLDNITDGILKNGEYSQLSKSGLTVMAGETTVTDCHFDGDVIVVNGAKVHFTNCEIKGTLIAQSPEKGSVRLENTPFGKLDAKNEYTVEILETKFPEKPQEKPEPPKEEITSDEEPYYDEGGDVCDPGPTDEPESEPQPEQEQAYNVVFCIEAFTVGGGYIIAPVKVPFEEGENVAYILDRVLTDNNLSYINTGSLDSGFYLASITQLEGCSFNIPDIIREKLESYGYQITEEPQQENILGEFDFTQGSGWMYSVNNEFPGMGMCDYYPQDNDVIRIVFTTAYGSDINGNNFDEYDYTNDFFEATNRDAITRAIAERGIDAFADYMDIITKPDATQEELDSIL